MLESNMATEGDFDFVVKWSGEKYSVLGLTNADTVVDLKNRIYELTKVQPTRQKLMGLGRGKPPADDAQLKDLKLKKSNTIMMMGSREEDLTEIEKPREREEDEESDEAEEDPAQQWEREFRAQNESKIQKRISTYQQQVFNPPSKNKLLVLDIDYTLFDHKNIAETGAELTRPYLHQFLTSAYEDYDIMIWSATNMKWIDAKLNEMGITSGEHNYKLTAAFDSRACVTCVLPHYGLSEVKPLQVIWGIYPDSGWGPKNTIMFDDLRRNFAFNQGQGLKIRPFKDAHNTRATDQELLKLSKYLKDIAQLDDFTVLNHRKWERYKPKKRKDKEAKETS